MSTLPPDPENRRRAVRYPAFVEARICYGPQNSVEVGCTIRNISTGGALIEAPEGALLPLSFRLLDEKQRLAYDCGVVWRRGNEVGVAFARIIDLNPKPGLAARALGAVKTLIGRARSRAGPV